GAIANDDVAFENLFRRHAGLLAQKGGIFPAEYVQKVKQQDSFKVTKKGKKTEDNKPKTVLTPDQQVFADRVKCPSCRKSMASCGCGICEGTIKRLSTLNVTNRTDDQILKDLFMGEDAKP
ncbi:MAG: hypothetical protein V1742_09545, partial [Pseudomonadota bacterium]